MFSSSFNQDYIKSKCGEQARTDITSSEHSCHQNGNVYCGEHSLYIRHNCTSYLSCTTQCANELRQASCCFNGDSYQTQHWFYSCNVSIPKGCPSTVQIPNISQHSSCSSVNEYSKQELKAMFNNIGLVINSFNQGERCKPFSNNYRDYCSYKDN